MESVANTIDVESTLERALSSASEVMNRAGAELGADTVAVLLATGTEIEITHFWSRSGESRPEQPVWKADPEVFGELTNGSGPVEAGSALARLLAEWISPRSRGVLLFPWRVRQRAVTVVFCFDEKAPVSLDVPTRVLEGLNLIGLATWSVKEVVRLRSELRTATNRLAGRKVVERAKGMLQREQGITEERAYEYLRGQSRRRRITLEAIAEEVVNGRRREAAELRYRSLTVTAR
jgi:ANTAR domain